MTRPTTSGLTRLEDIQTLFDASLQALARWGAASLRTFEDARQILPLMKQYGDAIEAFEKQAKDIIREEVITKGSDVPDTKGSKALIANGWRYEVRPQRTTLDPERVQALLQAKKIPLTSGMDAVISYALNMNKLDTLVEAGGLTKAELETCRYELKYSVQTPKEVK